MIYAILANAVGIVHALFVLFVVGGQVLVLLGWGLAWQWTRNLLFRRLHLAAIAVVVGISVLGYLCPLTVIESELRYRAGEAGIGDGFIAYWLDQLLYYNVSGRVFTLIYFGFAALVFLTYRAYPPRGRKS